MTTAPSMTNHKRTVKSFVLRQGRMTTSQRTAIETLWPIYGIELTHGLVDYTDLFSQPGPVTLEIGFGMGNSLVEMAKNMPERNFIGVEVHRPGIGSILQLIDNNQLTNIRIFYSDVVNVLNQCIPKESLACIQLFFPDPWPKRRHHKRRLVQTTFVDLICQYLMINGTFYVATDWQPYAEHTVNTLNSSNHLKNLAGQKKFIERPKNRPKTKFEHRGIRLGHQVWDMGFKRIS